MTTGGKRHYGFALASLGKALQFCSREAACLDTVRVIVCLRLLYNYVCNAGGMNRRWWRTRVVDLPLPLALGVGKPRDWCLALRDRPRT